MKGRWGEEPGQKGGCENKNGIEHFTESEIMSIDVFRRLEMESIIPECKINKNTYADVLE